MWPGLKVVCEDGRSKFAHELLCAHLKHLRWQVGSLDESASSPSITVEL